MSANRQILGKWGERAAGDYLTEHGYQIIDRNARTPYGEIDIVALQKTEKPRNAYQPVGEENPVVVFVEVKTRTTDLFGPPEVSIDARKRDHLLSSSQAYLQSHPELDGDWRVDVIAIQCKAGDSPFEITHFENAFSGFDPE
jgi:putative endonuclease